jgi:hypothetical protein
LNVVAKRLDAKDFDFDGFTICCDLPCFPLFIYGELVVEIAENLLRRSEFEEV